MSPKQIAPLALACAFGEELRKELSAQQIAEVIKRNEAEPDKGVCHSHDFCDANVVMAQAFAQFGCAEPDVGDDAVVAVWNAAWEIAIAREFADDDPLEVLSAELEAWCEAEGLPFASADEVRADLCDDAPHERSEKVKAQIDWLNDFEERWDSVMRCENARMELRVGGAA